MPVDKSQGHRLPGDSGGSILIYNNEYAADKTAADKRADKRVAS